jgi:MSHA biogenesis protein MshO
MRARNGFTLIELVMVIAILGVIATSVAQFMVQPVDAYLATVRRAELVDRAQTTLLRVTREVRKGLPNSVRVSGDGLSIEFLRVLSGGRYRREGVGDTLDFSAASDSFDVIGPLNDWNAIDVAASAVQNDCLTGTVDCLVIYNTGQTGANAYAGDNIAAVTAASADALTFAGAGVFPLESPGQRFYLIDGPVSFVCDEDAIYRFSDYAITASHANVDTTAELLAAGASRQLLADKVASCQFSYLAGTATRNGTLRAALVHSDAGESVRLLAQIKVRNSP